MALVDAALSTLLSKNSAFIVDHLKNSKLQLTNYFDFFIYPRIDPTDISLKRIASTLVEFGADAYITKVFCRDVKLPESRAVSYKHIDAITYAEGLEELGDISLSFFDTEAGLVSRYLQGWQDKIWTVETLGEGSFNMKQVIWNSNQEMSKQDADLFLRQKNGSLLQIFPVIKIKGIKLINFSYPQVSHEDREIVTIEANFTADDIFVNTDLLTNF